MRRRCACCCIILTGRALGRDEFHSLFTLLENDDLVTSEGMTTPDAAAEGLDGDDTTEVFAIAGDVGAEGEGTLGVGVVAVWNFVSADDCDSTVDPQVNNAEEACADEGDAVWFTQESELVDIDKCDDSGSN